MISSMVTGKSPNEMELSHRWPAAAGKLNDRGKLWELIDKSNLVITAASGWLERLVRPYYWSGPLSTIFSIS
jgi:hypothetical protein